MYEWQSDSIRRVRDRMLIGVRTTLREIERVRDLTVGMGMVIDHLYHFSLFILITNRHLAGRVTVPSPLFVAVSVLLKMQGKRLLPHYFLTNHALNSFVGLLQAKGSGVEGLLVLVVRVGWVWLLVIGAEELWVGGGLHGGESAVVLVDRNVLVSNRRRYCCVLQELRCRWMVLLGEGSVVGHVQTHMP